MDVKYITQAETPFFLDEGHFKSTNEKRDNILNVLVLRAKPGLAAFTANQRPARSAFAKSSVPWWIFVLAGVAALAVALLTFYESNNL